MLMPVKYIIVKSFFDVAIYVRPLRLGSAVEAPCAPPWAARLLDVTAAYSWTIMRAPNSTGRSWQA